MGANLGDAAATVEHALARLGSLGAVLRRSSLYRTKPWGRLDQPDFVNAAAILQTPLAPRELLEALQRIEREFGRTRGPMWGPRTLDLDILTYDDQHIDEPGLVVPHRGLRTRASVLIPLAEIDPGFVEPAAALPAGARAEVVPLGEVKR